MEVADVNDGGDINLKKALEVGEANLPFLTTLKPRPHYNALLFLHKNVFFFAPSLTVRMEEQLQSMEDKIKKNFQRIFYSLYQRIMTEMILRKINVLTFSFTTTITFS